MKTKLTFLLSLTFLFLFSSSSVVFGDSLQDSWEEKAKSLGIPMIPDAAVIMCEPESKKGFNWTNGTWIDVEFIGKKRLFKKLPLTESNCPFYKVEPEDNAFYKGLPRSRKVCIKNYWFGETPSAIGKVCKEYYFNRSGTWRPTIICGGFLHLLKAVISPNGLYHLAKLNYNLLPDPPDNYKDSQYIEWGKCATISP